MTRLSSFFHIQKYILKNNTFTSSDYLLILNTLCLKVHESSCKMGWQGFLDTSHPARSATRPDPTHGLHIKLVWWPKTIWPIEYATINDPIYLTVYKDEERLSAAWYSYLQGLEAIQHAFDAANTDLESERFFRVSKKLDRGYCYVPTLAQLAPVTTAIGPIHLHTRASRTPHLCPS